MRSTRAPTRSIPFYTSNSPPIAMATRSAATRAGPLPSAIMMRPQLGSAPLIAVFTSGELATERAASTASRRVRAPRTAISTSFVAPSPSSTSMRARRSVMASSARANWRSPLPPRSSDAFSASPLASRATVSLVDWSPSTVMRLNERSTERRSTRGSESRATIASVARKQNIVAMCGSSMPTPLAMPPMVTGRPATSTRRAASFGREPPALRREALHQLGQPGSDLVHRQRLADDAGGGDQDLARRDAQQLPGDPGHLARVLHPLLAGAHVRATRGGEDRLGPAVTHVLLRDEHRRALDLIGGEHRGRARGRRRVDEGQILLTARLDARRDAGGEDAGHGGDAPLQPLEVRHAGYGYTGGASRPVRSSHPIMMLRLWMPLAEPPLPRLSSADTHTARLVRGSATTVTS